MQLRTHTHDILTTLSLLPGCVHLQRGKKAICGSQEGFLNIFNWGEWGMYQDRFAGHPGSVESIVKIDEDTIITGASDGMLRYVVYIYLHTHAHTQHVKHHLCCLGSQMC